MKQSDPLSRPDSPGGHFDPDKEYGPRSQKHLGWTIERTGGSFTRMDSNTFRSVTEKDAVPPTWHTTDPHGNNPGDMFFDHPAIARHWIEHRVNGTPYRPNTVEL
jgi:hypothetical protein